MPLITAQEFKDYGEQEVVYFTLDGSDTFEIALNADQFLYLQNDSGGAVTSVSMIGDEAPSSAPSTGIGDFTPVAYSIASIADGEAFVVPIGLYSQLFKGTVTITGGTGLKAALLQNS